MNMAHMDDLPVSSSSNLTDLEDQEMMMSSSNDQVASARRDGRDGRPSRDYIPLQQVNPGFRETDDDVFDDEEEEFYRQHPGLARHRHSSARLYRQSSHRSGALPAEILSMLPSRSLSVKVDDEVDGVMSDSTKYRSIREAKLRRRKSLHNAAFRRPSMEMNVTDGVMNDLMSSTDQGTLDSRASSALRDIPTSLRHKISIRRQITTLDRKKMKKPSWTKRTKYAMSMTMDRFKRKLAAIRYSLGFWQGHLKLVEGYFGTGVTSYFIFLRFLFLLNLPLFFLSFSFIVIPQLLYRFLQKEPYGYTENANFTGLELLTGGGWLEDTVMYYGYYINGTVNVFAGRNGTYAALAGLSYSMPYAYLLSCAGFYLLCLIILGHKIAKSYRKNFVDSSETIQEHFIVKVLNGWNYTVTDKDAATLRHKFNYKEMTEYLSVTRRGSGHDRSCGEWCRLGLIRLMANIFVLGLIAGSTYIVWYLCDQQPLKDDQLLQVLREMALPLCIAAINIVMPAAFSMIGSIEAYGKPKITLYLALTRTMLLKGTTLGVLIYFWLVQLTCHQKDVVSDKQCTECWETYMGQEIYRLVLVDFIAYIITVIGLEFFRRLFSVYCCKYLGKPEFDIGRNTLDLIFSQALCWLGAFYSPLLSLIQLLKLFILFYIKRYSVVWNCAPSQKPWRAARTNTVFLAFLFCAFLMMAISVAMSIIVIRPSATCGPFRGLNSTYDIVLNLVDGWREQYPILSGFIRFFTSEGAVSGLLITLICFLYYLRIMAKGRQELVQFLLHQVRLEGRDKNFLLRKYQEIHAQNGSTLTQNGRHFPGKNTSLPQIATIVHTDEVSPRLARSAASAAVTPPTPYTEITPSSESVLPLTDYSDGQTPESFTPASETPASERTPHSASVTPGSVTLALTPDSEHSDVITAMEIAHEPSPTDSAEIPPPDYLQQDAAIPPPDYDAQRSQSDAAIPPPDYLQAEGQDEECPSPDYDPELRDFNRDAGLDRASRTSDHEGYLSAWK